MALENMKSQFQPQATTPSNGLAANGGLENQAPNDSGLDLDNNPILSNALANNEGLESVTNQGSLLNIDDEPEETTGLANGVGLEALTSADSELDIDTNPNNSNGLNQSTLSTGLSSLEIGQINNISDGLASNNI
tara:strand:- start:264 stop:668 length:405 start_codon:yes stop_codon:yes gene_type:complete